MSSMRVHLAAGSEARRNFQRVALGQNPAMPVDLSSARTALLNFLQVLLHDKRYAFPAHNGDPGDPHQHPDTIEEDWLHIEQLYVNMPGIVGVRDAYQRWYQRAQFLAQLRPLSLDYLDAILHAVIITEGWTWALVIEGKEWGPCKFSTKLSYIFQNK